MGSHALLPQLHGRVFLHFIAGKLNPGETKCFVHCHLKTRLNQNPTESLRFQSPKAGNAKRLCQTWPHTFRSWKNGRFLLGSCTEWKHRRWSGRSVCGGRQHPTPGARWFGHTARLCNGSAIIQPPWVLSPLPAAHFCAPGYTPVEIYRCTEYLGRKTQESGGSFPWETGDTEELTLHCTVLLYFLVSCAYINY